MELETLDIRHDADAGRFEAELPAGRAYLLYRREGDVLDLLSTWVPPEHRHRGVGEAIVLAALEHASRRGLRVIPTCPFIPGVIRRHPEYADLVASGT